MKKLLILASLLVAAAGVCASQPRAGDDLQERLFVAQFGLGADLDTLYQKEEERLLGACRVYGSACFAEHFSDIRRRVAVLRKEPQSSAPRIGYVVAVLKVGGHPHGGLAIGLDIETADAPVRAERWMDTVGDWGYGVHVSGVRPRGEWLQLFGLPLIGDGWVSVSEPDFQALVSPLSQQILELQTLVATFPDDSRRQIPAGSYLVLRVLPGRVEFRREVETDFDCGQPVEAPRVMPPLLTATPAEFFDADRTPRFSVKYQRGC